MPPLNESGRTKKRIAYLGVALLFLLALVKFAYEDMLRLAYPVNDLTAPWVSAQAFLHGEVPYGDTPQLDAIWAATGIPASAEHLDYSHILSDLPMAYPPTALALIAPLGLLHWHTAVWTYVIGATCLFVFAVLMLAQKLPIPWHNPRKLYFVAFVLAMAPLHEGSQMANPVTLTVACLCLGVGLLSRKPFWSGIAIALAMCLKPQVAILFFAYLCLRRKWKTAFTALAAGAALSAGSLLWMRIHHVAWFNALLDQAAQTTSPVGVYGFYPPGTTKFQLLNLQVLVVQFVQNLKWSGILAWVVFALLAGAAAFLIHRRVSDKNESTGIAIVAVLTLLSFYQRFHAAEILLFVAYWAVDNWDSKGAKTALLLLLPLLFPFTAWLAAYAGLPLQPASSNASIPMKIAIVVERFIENHNLDSSLLWNGFAMPHVIWIELILAVILLAGLSRPLDVGAAES